MAALSSISSSATQKSTSPYDSASAPPKYALENNIRHLNEDYVHFMQRQNKTASTALEPKKALPIVCSQQQLQQYENLQRGSLAISSEIPGRLSETLNTWSSQVGLSPEGLWESIDVLCMDYDIPIGLINKLEVLQTFDRLEFIVDDSSSMRLHNRWAEVEERLKTLIKIMAYVPIPPVIISFLNRPEKVLLERDPREDPNVFVERAHTLLSDIFRTLPRGNTPILSVLNRSFMSGAGCKIARYLFCDGEPDDGIRAKRDITRMLVERLNPKENPVTLLSCTDRPQDVVWMCEVEEKAPFCAEYDDFVREREEVHNDQGSVFPFTRGVYLICELVGAMNPDDLDALDESIPLTKQALDNLLGVASSTEEYEQYFLGFMAALQLRPVENDLDLVKRQQSWIFDDFFRARSATDIEAVRRFRSDMASCPLDQKLAPPPFSEEKA